MGKHRIISLITALCLIVTLFPAMFMAANADNACKAPKVSISINTGKYSGKPQLKWQAVDGAEEYYIYRSTEKDGEFSRTYTTCGCSYTNTLAVPGTTYYYKVAAVTADGTESVSDIVSIAALCDAPDISCQLVDGTNAQGKAYKQLPQISWDAVDGAVSYQVCRADTKNGDYTLLTTTKKCSYVDTSAKHGHTYYYKVAAVDSTDSANYSSAIKAAVKCVAPKISYKLVSGTTSKGVDYTQEPKISWDAVEGAVKYKVYRATSKDGDYELRVTTKKCSYTNTAAKHGRVYYYKVAAVDSAGNATTSSPLKVIVKCATPEVTIKRTNGISNDKPYVGKPMLEWLVVDGATSYKVYRSTSKDGTYKYIYTTSNTYMINYSANSGTKYYYKVKAIGKDTSANSAFSKIKYITTTAATPESKIPAKKYSITVNYQTNTVNVYTYDKDGKYSVPVKAMICSTGDATPHSGKYSLASTSKWNWQPLFGNVNGHYVVQITGNILFHSVPYTAYGDPASLEYWEFDKLGTAASMGCVRLQVKDARWIYEHKSDIKAVRFYASDNPGPLGQPVAPKISGNKACRGWDPSDTNSDNPWHDAKITAGNYVGMQADKAVTAAGERGFNVQRIAYKHSSEPEGTVIAQSIKSGSKAAMNAKLTLTVSAGE